MSGVAEELEEIFNSNRQLRKDLAGWHREAEKQKERALLAEEMVERLKEKVAAIEKHDSLLDFWDEQFLFDHRVELKFYRRSDGTRRLVLRPRVGHKILVRGFEVPEGQSFIKIAMGKASGRTRSSKKQ